MLHDDAIEVTGTGSAGGVPDLVLLDVRLQHDADTVALALSGVEQASRAMLAAAHAETGLRSAQTQSLGVRPRHDQQGIATAGFTAYSQVRLAVLGAEQVGKLVPALAEAAGDAMSIENLSLDIADPAPLLTRAREAAFADARDRAEQYARLAGRRLGGVLAVLDSPAILAPPGPARAFARAEAGGMPVAAGEHTVHATVSVRWSLGVR